MEDYFVGVLCVRMCILGRCSGSFSMVRGVTSTLRGVLKDNQDAVDIPTCVCLFLNFGVHSLQD